MELEAKKALRKEFRSMRSELTTDDLRVLNQQLLTQFRQFDWKGIDYLHTFLPISRLNEPNTLLFIEWLQVTYANISVVVSKSDLNTKVMNHYIWKDGTLLELNVWGIQEPLGGKEVSSVLLDAVLVPLLAFDRVGNRVGYGGGFYDRFLASCRPDCLKIGISFFEPVERVEDADELDIPLDYCITPDTIYKF